MSNCICAIKFDDGVILYGEYYGNVDVPYQKFYDSTEAVQLNWRNHENVKCTCENPYPDSVEFYSDYGGGYYIIDEITACKVCKCTQESQFQDNEWHDIDEVNNDWAAELEPFLLSRIIDDL